MSLSKLPDPRLNIGEREREQVVAWVWLSAHAQYDCNLHLIMGNIETVRRHQRKCIIIHRCECQESAGEVSMSFLFCSLCFMARTLAFSCLPC